MRNDALVALQFPSRSAWAIRNAVGKFGLSYPWTSALTFFDKGKRGKSNDGAALLDPFLSGALFSSVFIHRAALPRHHYELHRHGNEMAWWANLQIAPLETARELWEATTLEPTGKTATNPVPANDAESALTSNPLERSGR